jgi:hypothetical protein
MTGKYGERETYKRTGDQKEVEKRAEQQKDKETVAFHSFEEETHGSRTKRARSMG